VDLELSDEQVWLEESINSLLERHWPPAQDAWEADDTQRGQLWDSFVEFGVLGGSDGQLGAIELCLIARAIGSHLGSVPFLGSVGARYALAPFTAELPDDVLALLHGNSRIAIALLEPGGGWSPSDTFATVQGGRLTGVKAAVEFGDQVDLLAVVVRDERNLGLALVRNGSAGIEHLRQPSLDTTVPLSRVTFDGAEVETIVGSEPDATLTDRLTSVCGLLVAAEAVGAATQIFTQARQYASERRQFGRTIGSNQALRHLMSDLYVRQASSWSTTLYAAAALDDGIPGAQRTASIAKAYVSRAAREVAHGSMQVFGGIAFTEEHPAHRFLRRIVAREQQFGDATHHERELGRGLARAAAERVAAIDPDRSMTVR
jgi:alkylation response protein AidB-like acyl-CoA dehydrogenase